MTRIVVVVSGLRTRAAADTAACRDDRTNVIAVRNRGRHWRETAVVFRSRCAR